MSDTAVVVGAGIIGASIAWRLAQRGCQVTLLEAGSLGGEASWAGAGMLAPGGELEEPSEWTAFALESLRLYPEFVRELTSESGLAIDFQRHGAFDLAFDAPQLAALERKARVQHFLGIASEPVATADLPGYLGPVAGAAYYPADALVDPRDLMAALRIACIARGVELREHTRAHAMAASASGVRVETDAGELSADAAVLAAGAWSSSVRVTVDGRPYALPESVPVRGHLIGYAQPPGLVGPILRSGGTYLLQRSGGLLVAGTTTEYVGFNRSLDPAAVQEIQARAARVIPQLAGQHPIEQWLGFRPGTASGVPAIDRAGNSAVSLAYGHYRNGILLAPATALRVAASW